MAGNGKQVYVCTHSTTYIFYVFFLLFFPSAGVSISAPIWGRIVDLHGPRILLLISFVLLLGGYSGIKHFYDFGLPPGTSTLPAPSFYILVFCNFLTGSGSFGGLTSSLNSIVKSFPDGVVSEINIVIKI